MQDSKNTQQPDSDVRAFLDEQFESNFLGHFDSREDFKASLTKDSYPNSVFGMVAGELVMAFEVIEPKVDCIETEMASYRNAEGALVSKEDYYREAAKAEMARLDIAQLQQSFKAESVAAVSQEAFMPAEFLTKLLREEGHADPEAWAVDLDPRCSDPSIKVQERIFFVNRALRLYMSEQEGRNHMDARMLLADGLQVDEWSAIVVRGVVPWLMNKLPVSKTQLAEAAALVSAHTEQTVQSHEPTVEQDPAQPEQPAEQAA